MKVYELTNNQEQPVVTRQKETEKPESYSIFLLFAMGFAVVAVLAKCGAFCLSEIPDVVIVTLITACASIIGVLLTK